MTGIFTGFRGSTFIVIGGRFSVRLRRRGSAHPYYRIWLDDPEDPGPQFERRPMVHLTLTLTRTLIRTLTLNLTRTLTLTRTRRLFCSLMRQELDFFSAVRTGDMTSG